MTVCAHRTDTPGFFTPCAGPGTSCVCGAEVAADQTDHDDEGSAA